MKSPFPLRVFVCDDEAPARRKLIRLLSHDADVALVGEAGNGEDAVQGIEQTKPHLAFLDVQMPRGDGFDVVEALPRKSMPRIVFVTAHDEYAIRAFEVHAFGYLLKPFDQARFIRVLTDAKQHLQSESPVEAGARFEQLLAELRLRGRPSARLLVQENGRGFFVELNEIDWAESERNYLQLHQGAHVYTVRGTLEDLSGRLHPSDFLRINRSCLVRLGFIRELQRWSHGEYRVVFHTGQTRIWTRRYLNQHPELLRKL